MYELQGLVIGGMQFLFAAMCAPTLWNRASQVPRLTSGLTALGLFVITVTFLTMGPLWFSVTGGATCTLMWVLIFVLRPVRETVALPIGS